MLHAHEKEAKDSYEAYVRKSNEFAKKHCKGGIGINPKEDTKVGIDGERVRGNEHPDTMLGIKVK